MLPSKLSPPNRAFLMVALLADRKNAADLIAYLPPNDRSALTAALEAVAGQDKESKKQIILSELKRLANQERLSPLAEIHADWIAESLKKETPRTVATVLRYLPGEKVSQVLERLPSDLLKSLPPLSHTFALDGELVQILKRRFEHSFSTQHLETSSFLNRLLQLTAAELLALFRDLGVRELAAAFRTLQPQTIQVLLVRLPGKDALDLKEAIKLNSDLPPERMKLAQNHLIALKPEKGDASQLILEAGFFIFSKSVLVEDLEGVRSMQQKFSLPLGRLLKRQVEQNLPFNAEAAAGRYRHEVLEALGRLAQTR